jgi:ketosteroid isomerase-like protein
MIDRASMDRSVRALHAARVAGDLEALCALFSREAHFRVAGSSLGSPIAMSAQGADEIRLWLSILVRTFRLSDYELLSLLIDESGAAVHWRARNHSKVTGLAVATELVDLVQMDGERIASYTELFVPCATGITER